MNELDKISDKWSFVEIENRFEGKIKLAFAMRQNAKLVRLTSYGARHLGPRSHILISKTIYLRFHTFRFVSLPLFCTDPINHNLDQRDLVFLCFRH